MMARQIEQQRGALGIAAVSDPRRARERERAKRKLRITTSRDGDGGTPELQQHHRLATDITAVEGIEAVARRVVDQRKLDRYKSRGLLNDKQWAAGDRIASIAFRAGLMPRVTARYSTMPRNPSTEDDVLTDRDLALYDYRTAMAAIGVTEWEVLPNGLRAPIVRQTPMAAVVVAVCVLDEAAADWSRRQGRYRSKPMLDAEGMTTLRLALDGLASHWRMR